mgnify:CR=1 FL=1
MDENDHKKVYRQKRPKIRVRENKDNLDYYSSMTEENIELDKIKNLKLNNDLFLNNNNRKIERKRSAQSEKRSKKPLTEFQKKMKNILIKFSSDSFKLKLLFHKWAYITFSKRNNFVDNEEEEEEEEEIENAKYDNKNKNKNKINKFKKNNKNKNDSDEEEEDEDEEEEEDEEKIKLMNDLNLNNLEEIEERPPNEEESAMTSIVAKARNPKNRLNVALRKIIKYKNIFYGYFTKWKKVINIPNILIILKYQKKLKNLFRKLDGKRDLLKLAMAFKTWKMKCEKLKTGDKKIKKKKKIIIYKKKNGEMEIKERLEDYNNLIPNKDDNDKLSIKKDGIKIKTVKKRIIKKKISSSKSKQSKMPTINNNIIINNNNNITPIKQNHSTKDNIINIHINKKESEKSESNMSATSDNKIEIEKTGEENSTKRKKIVKKIKKIVKKVKKSKKDEKIEKTEKDKNNLPPLYISSDQVKISKPLNYTEKSSDTEKEISSISSNKPKVKKKIKKVNKINIKDSSNKSLDFLLQKEKGKENKDKVLTKSYNPNIESINSNKMDEISRAKSITNNNSRDKIKIKKKKIIHKSKKKTKNNINEEIKIEDNTNTNSEDTTDKMNSIVKRENSLKDNEENTQKNINIISEQNGGEKEDSKKFPPSKITFITDDENKDERRKSITYHNLGKDSRIDLNAIIDSDLMDYSEDTSEDEIKKKKKVKKSKKKGEEFSKDEINPDIINIEITQDDDESDNKSKKNKKKKKTKRVFTKEEKELIKIYKRAYHLLRRAIRSFKKRNKANEEFKQSLELNNYFIKWKNKFRNTIDIPKLDNEEKEGNNNLEENKNEEEDTSNNNNILDIKKEELNNNESKEDLNEDNNNNNFELNKNNIVNKLTELAQINNRIQNETIDNIKNANEDTFKDIYLDQYIKLIENNNQNIYAYKILCLYVKFNKKFIYMKTSNPKQWYFIYWNKIIKK